MSRYFVILALIALCYVGVWAQQKPQLEEATVMAYVDCPDKKEDTCLLLRVSGNYYIVKGRGYNKEEYIWQVDSEAVVKARNEDLDFSFSKYIKLVWSKYST